MRRLALIGTTAIAAGPFGGPNFGQLVSRKELVRISGQGFRRVRQTRNEDMCDGKFGGTTTSHRSPFLGHLTCLLSSFRLGQGQFCGLFLGSR